MIKKNFIGLGLILVFAFFLPTSTAITLVENAHTDLFFGDRISYLNHRPANTQKTPPVFSLDQRQNVERNFLANLPKNLEQMDVKTRKNQFIGTLLPLILRVNELIVEEREQVKFLMAKQWLSFNEETWLLQTALRYKLSNDSVSSIDASELLLRMNAIPPSLALAQAAIESGWGTSRFAQQANALYGQWTWSDTDSAGLVPSGRAEGERHRIKSFAYLIQSVRAYALNLNSHNAYADFRTTRALDNDGNDLTNTLIAYSTRREAYVQDLQAIIRTNQFAKLDQMLLTPAL